MYKKEKEKEKEMKMKKRSFQTISCMVKSVGQVSHKD